MDSDRVEALIPDGQAGSVWDELVDVSEILEAFRPWAENGEDRRHGLESYRRPALGRRRERVNDVNRSPAPIDRVLSDHLSSKFNAEHRMLLSRFIRTR